MKKTGLLAAVCAAILLSGCDFNFGFGESSTVKKEVTVKFNDSNIKCTGKLGSISSGAKVAKGTKLTFTSVQEMDDHCVFKGSSRTIDAWTVDSKEQSFKDPHRRDTFSYTLGGSKDSITVGFTTRDITKNIKITYDDTKIACEKKDGSSYTPLANGGTVNEFTKIRIANRAFLNTQVVTEWQLKDSSGIISSNTPRADFDQLWSFRFTTKKQTVNIAYKTRARKKVDLTCSDSNITFEGWYRMKDVSYTANAPISSNTCYEGLWIRPKSKSSSKVIDKWTKREDGETYTTKASSMGIVMNDAITTVTYK